jgi:hypothetical protein
MHKGAYWGSPRMPHDLSRILHEQALAAANWRDAGGQILQPGDQPPYSDAQCAWLGVEDWLMEEAIVRLEGDAQ